MEKSEAIESILELQKRASHVLVNHAFEHWQKLDVPMAQLKSLFIIVNREKTNFRSLSRDLGVTPGNVTGLVNRLVEQGFVTRKPDPLDRRIIWLESTEKGYNLVINLMDTHSRQMTNILNQMSLDDLMSLARGLKGFQRVLESNVGIDNQS